MDGRTLRDVAAGGGGDEVSVRSGAVVLNSKSSTELFSNGERSAVWILDGDGAGGVFEGVGRASISVDMAEDGVDYGALGTGARDMDGVGGAELLGMSRAGVGDTATGFGDAGEVGADVGNTSAGVDAGGVTVDGTRRDGGGEDIADGIDVASVVSVVGIGDVGVVRVFLVDVDGVSDAERVVVIGDLSTNARNVVRRDAGDLEVVRTVDGEGDGRGFAMGRRIGSDGSGVVFFYAVEGADGGATSSDGTSALFGVIFCKLNLFVFEGPLSGADRRFDGEGASLSRHDGIFTGAGGIEGEGGGAFVASGGDRVAVGLATGAESDGERAVETIAASNAFEVVGRVETNDEFVTHEVGGDFVVIAGFVDGLLPELVGEDGVRFVIALSVVTSDGVIDVESGVNDESLVAGVCAGTSLGELTGSKLGVMGSGGDVNLVGEVSIIIFPPDGVLEGDAERIGVGGHAGRSATIYAVVITVGDADGFIGDRSSVGNALAVVEDLSIVRGELRLGVDSNGARSTERSGARDGVTGVLVGGGVVRPSNARNNPDARRVNVRRGVGVGILDLPRDIGVHGFAEDGGGVVVASDLMGEVGGVGGGTGIGIVAPFANLGVGGGRGAATKTTVSVAVMIDDGANTVAVGAGEAVVGGHSSGDGSAGEGDGLGVGGVSNGDAGVVLAGEVTGLTVVVVVEDTGVIAEVETAMLLSAANVDVDGGSRARPRLGFVGGGDAESVR